MDRNKKPVFLLISFFLHGCCGPQCQFERVLNEHDGNGDGGGTDAIVTDLPFPAGYRTQCVQGVNGSYSHMYTSTKYDVDLDTPNDQNDLVFAPKSGTAYVHDDGAHNFGRHVNLDLHDGTYLVMGHLEDVFVADATDVTAGEILGFEGTTGASTGDHTHFGRHAGDPKKSAVYGSSLSGLKLSATDVATGQDVEVLTTEAVCSLSGGHVYESKLPTALWHPPGSFLKTPWDSGVYERTANNGLVLFQNEDAFLSRGYSFADVTLISDEELACYSAPVSVSNSSQVRALKDSTGRAWLLLGLAADPERERFEIQSTGASALLASYGIRAGSFNDIDYGANSDISQYPNAGHAVFRTGSLVAVEGQSDVYVMDEGVAMPIRDWDTYLLLGNGPRDIIRMTSGEFLANITAKGNCATDQYCVSHEDVTECNHSEEVDHEQQSSEDSGQDLPDGEDSGDGQDSAVAEEAFSLRWLTPGGVTADWITVAGTWTTASGEVTVWDPVLAEAHGQNAVSYSLLDANSGDQLRFSMAYGVGNTESWSCLAPYPPGLVQGTVDVRANGVSIPFQTTADPDSDGCQLQVTVP